MLENKGVVDVDSAIQKSGLSVGYPAWNLLYYSVICSLSHADKEAIVVETGTNQGFSTIVMAQALMDIDAKGFVYTVDIDEKNVQLAKQNVRKAGLDRYVKFYEGDAFTFLADFVKSIKYIDRLLLLKRIMEQLW